MEGKTIKEKEKSRYSQIWGSCKKYYMDIATDQFIMLDLKERASNVEDVEGVKTQKNS